MVLRRRDVTIAAVVAFFAWGYAISWLPALRWILHAFVVGILATIFTVAGLILLIARGPTVSSPPGRPHTLSRFQGLVFPGKKQWFPELAALQDRQNYRKGPIGSTPSVEVSEAIDQFLILFNREFVQSWYHSISANSSFPNEVDRTLRFVVAGLVETLQRLDLAEVVTSRIIPILTAHFHDFYDAERAVRGRKLNKAMTDSEELDLAIASKFRDGKLHVSASLSFPDTRLIQQEHLRGICSQLLRRFLPPNMASSGLAMVVIRELVACALLSPIMQIVSDPDTWNRLMEMYGRSMLQDRSTVKKLRAALDEHAFPTPKPARPSAIPRLLPGESERRFEKFIRAIRRTSNLSDARRFRSEIVSQLKRDSLQADTDPIYVRRLEVGKRLLDQKIQHLTASTDGKDTRQGIGLNSGVDRQPATPLGRQILTSPPQASSLVDILRDSSGLSYFMEYMDRQRLLPLVQFWLVVDGFRNPLEEDVHEDVDVEEDTPGGGGEAALGGESNVPNNTRNKQHEPFDDDEQGADSTLPMWTESDRADLEQIDHAYLSKSELKISQSIKQRIRIFLSSGRKATPLQYQRARYAILAAQSTVLKEMQSRHFPSFQNSDLFYKHLASHDAMAPPPGEGNPSSMLADVSENSGSSSIELDPGQHNVQSFASHDVTDRPQSTYASGVHSIRPVPDRRVIQAMEQALNTIMEDSRPDTAKGLRASLCGNESGQDDDVGSASGSGLLAPRDSATVPTHSIDKQVAPLKQDSSGKPSLASLGLVSAASRIGVFVDDDLFADEDGGEHPESHDEGPAHLSGDDGDDQIHEAAPGDLGLAEAIMALSNDIERLSSQDAVIESLTRKAELTNNTAELRILRKSKTSLQREMRRKELQRQQYVVQESDNSLYGRSTVSIKSIQVGQDDDGREFAMYMIEVQRDAGEQMPAAIWVVARRYSEFHELHQKLRSRYSSVRGLDFPPRRVVMKFQSEFLRKRRQALEKYIRGLLLLPDVCRGRDLRAFLSQSAIVADAGKDVTAKEDRKDMMSRLYNSVADGMDDFLGNITVIDQISLAGQNLIAAATSQFTSGVLSGPTDGGIMSLATAAEAEAELSAFDDKEAEPFIKPICDIFLEIFELNRGNNWLRGRAVVMVLQQLMGGTIERKVRDNVRLLTQADVVTRCLELARLALFPPINSRDEETIGPQGGADSVPPNHTQSQQQQQQQLRTDAEKTHTRTEASLMLATLIPELAANVVGRLNAQAASRRIFATLNNSRLNAHLAFTLLDEIVMILLE